MGKNHTKASKRSKSGILGVSLITQKQRGYILHYWLACFTSGDWRYHKTFPHTDEGKEAARKQYLQWKAGIYVEADRWKIKKPYVKVADRPKPIGSRLVEAKPIAEIKPLQRDEEGKVGRPQKTEDDKPLPPLVGATGHYRKDLNLVFINEAFYIEAGTEKLMWKNRPRKHFKLIEEFRFFNENYAEDEVICHRAPDGDTVVFVRLGHTYCVYLRELIWFISYGEWPPVLKHRNGDIFDCKPSNLEVAGANEFVFADLRDKNGRIKATRGDVQVPALPRWKQYV
ncbi:MAG: hypothetical protein ACR2N8_01210 [Parvibaculales bacterium]